MIRNVLFFIGAFLLAINLFGLTKTLRSPEITPPVSLADFSSKVQKENKETPLEYASRMTLLVHNSTVHAWPTPQEDSFSVVLPIWENWCIYLLKFIHTAFVRYEFTNIDKAMERGVGLCSQRAIILSEILKKEGIKAPIVALKGHVVVTLDSKNGPILDPDFGVVLPLSLQKAKKTPSLVAQSYTPDHAPMMEKIFSGPSTICERGVTDYLAKRVWVEPILYIAKWLIPILLIIPCCISKKRRN